MRVTGPEEFEVPIGERSPITLPPLRRAGLYEITGAHAPLDTLAVSMLSDQESDIRPREAVAVNAEAALASSGSGAAARPLWPWLIAAAVALAVIEWLAWCARARA